ncbi:MAG: LptF/LptG family permease [Puniceicoccales bacterium]|nr:LptF/LptG family permease [Puniceicoccales bacterium]
MILPNHVGRCWARALFCTFPVIFGILLLERIQHELPELLRGSVGLRAIAFYFLLLLPSLIPLALPVSFFVGTLLSLGRLRRDGEIVAMRCGGVRLLTMTRFLWIGGFCGALLLQLLIFTLLPVTESKLQEFTEALKAQRPALRRGERQLRNVTYDGRDTGRLWLVGELDLETDEARRIGIYACGKEGIVDRGIHAPSGRYREGRWLLDGVRGQIGGANFLDLREDPEVMALCQRRIRSLSPAKLALILKHIPRRDPARAAYATGYHMALSGCWSCFIALFCAIPFATAGPRAGPLATAAKAVIALLLFYFLVSCCQALGAGGRVPPVLAAWLPNGLFLLYGLFLMARAR